MNMKSLIAKEAVDKKVAESIAKTGGRIQSRQIAALLFVLYDQEERLRKLEGQG